MGNFKLSWDPHSADDNTPWVGPDEEECADCGRVRDRKFMQQLNDSWTCKSTCGPDYDEIAM